MVWWKGEKVRSLLLTFYSRVWPTHNSWLNLRVSVQYKLRAIPLVRSCDNGIFFHKISVIKKPIKLKHFLYDKPTNKLLSVVTHTSRPRFTSRVIRIVAAQSPWWTEKFHCVRQNYTTDSALHSTHTFLEKPEVVQQAQREKIKLIRIDFYSILPDIRHCGELSDCIRKQLYNSIV